MQDKDMILDVLCNAKTCLANYSVAITECKNIPIREKLQKMRDGDEQFQYELYQLADKKGFYPAHQQPTSQDISNAKASMIQTVTQQQGSGPSVLE